MMNLYGEVGRTGALYMETVQYSFANWLKSTAKCVLLIMESVRTLSVSWSRHRYCLLAGVWGGRYVDQGDEEFVFYFNFQQDTFNIFTFDGSQTDKGPLM